MMGLLGKDMGTYVKVSYRPNPNNHNTKINTMLAKPHKFTLTHRKAAGSF